jgi:hypothetical protein
MNVYSGSDLRGEIKEIVNRTVANGIRVRAAWIATEICNNHPYISGEDSEFWSYTGASGVHAEVRRFLSSVKSDEGDESKQGKLPFTMPGYQYLQKMYFVSDLSDEESDGAPVGIPLTEMTDEQVELKAKELERMASGCMAHADELRRYARNRKQAA